MDVEDSRVGQLISQCKSNDVDAKIDAVTKLQAEFENGIEITDAEALITTLKACLRISNQHLTTATVSALPPLLPLLISRSVYSRPTQSSISTSSTASSVIDAATLRHVLLAFLPSPGVIDRLGDSREKSREKARETLVILGGMAFRSGGASVAKSRDGKGTETPLMIFERYLKESGLSSKVWRVREQSILTLVHIRRVHHLFPIRAYLTLLVGALEDTDGNVRECARQSIVELFTGPAVTDAARADLKKELTKKGTRKQIVDSVLSKILSGGSGGSNPVSEAGSENGDVASTGSREAGGKKGYVPPSLALMNRSKSGPAVTGRTVSQSSSIPRPASRAAMVSPPLPTPPVSEGPEVRPVYIASSRDLDNEFAAMAKHFEGKESEHNWQGRDKAITRVRGMLKGDVHVRYTETFLANLKQFLDWSLKTLVSLRTTVASNTCSLYVDLVMALETGLDPFCDTLLVNLLRMASLTKKITAQQSQDTATTIITHTSAPPRVVVPLLWSTLQDKNIQARTYAISHVRTYLEVHAAHYKYAIEAQGHHEVLEKCVKKGLADSNPGVREGARLAFWAFEAIWKQRASVILQSLDATARKHVEKVCPNPDAVVALPPTTPQVKKSSVAAAIAATRAKAKAVATAPPTLRHQATSSAYAARAASPPASRSPLSPTGTSSRSKSPPSPPKSRSRVVSAGTGTLGRSASSSVVPGPIHSRTMSAQSPGISPPPSPNANGDPFNRWRTSPQASPTGGRGLADLRKAMQTALPSSPENSTPSVGPTSPTPSGGRGGSALRSTSAGRPTPGTTRAPISRVVPTSTKPRSHMPTGMNGGSDDESLLMATTIPIPEDNDDDMEQSMDLISFSTPYELYPPAPGSATDSGARTPVSPNSNENVLSTHSLISSPPNERMVDDAMRARAEQAESAAERLLELVEPEEDGVHTSPIPPSLRRSSESTAKVKVKPTVAAALRAGTGPPSTPMDRSTAIMRQAALFKDSPAYNGGSTSLLDVLKDRKHETGWWLKRMSLVDHGTPLRAIEPADKIEELKVYIAALERGDADVRVLQKLALLCIESPVVDPSMKSDSFLDPSSPFIDKLQLASSLSADMWTQDKTFDRLFKALIEFLNPEKPEDELEYGLIVLWEMLEHQAPYIEARETDVFSLMLHIRYCNKLNVIEATNTIRDALTMRIEPVYGLTTLHASLRTFMTAPIPPSATVDTKAGIYAFGLVALGKFMLRLPAEVLEDELPRLRATLISALNDTSSLIIRESAAACIIAAQLVLRDETHLFALLDGLADEKKNLLTYLFDKHEARGIGQVDDTGSSGMERLEREMRRLDTRTSTPLRGI